MSKAKEYFDQFYYKTKDPRHRALIMKSELVGKEMNHKTLEDVEELISKRIIKYANEPHIKNEPLRHELIEVLQKLKSLKL